MTEIKIRPATVDDAKLLTDLAYTTFWDAFAHHPKNAPDDLAHYMRQAFSIEQITEELADPKSLFLIAEIDGEPAGYAKLIFDTHRTRHHRRVAGRIVTALFTPEISRPGRRASIDGCVF